MTSAKSCSEDYCPHPSCEREESQGRLQAACNSLQAGQNLLTSKPCTDDDSFTADRDLFSTPRNPSTYAEETITTKDFKTERNDFNPQEETNHALPKKHAANHAKSMQFSLFPAKPPPEQTNKDTPPHCFSFSGINHQSGEANHGKIITQTK